MLAVECSMPSNSENPKLLRSDLETEWVQSTPRCRKMVMAKIFNSYHKFKSNMTTAAGRTLNIVLKISWWYGQKYIFENILVVRSKIYY